MVLFVVLCHELDFAVLPSSLHNVEHVVLNEISVSLVLIEVLFNDFLFPDLLRQLVILLGLGYLQMKLQKGLAV